MKKSATTDFTLTVRGVAHSKSRDVLLAKWKSATTGQGLLYRDFKRTEEEENWYGTFGPYIDFFCGFGLRLKELRLGHDKMPVGKRDDVMIEVPV